MALEQGDCGRGCGELCVDWVQIALSEGLRPGPRDGVEEASKDREGGGSERDLGAGVENQRVHDLHRRPAVAPGGEPSRSSLQRLQISTEPIGSYLATEVLKGGFLEDGCVELQAANCEFF